MRRVCVALLACLPLAWAGSAHAEVVVAISKSEQRLSVRLDGAEAYRWKISTGRASRATPSGTFRPIRLERHWYSHKFGNAPMPWSVFFHGGYAVHGTLEVSHLGRPASHGCVRLKPEQAHTLYSLIQREGADHTRITVLDGPLPRAPHVPADVPVARRPPAAAPSPPARTTKAHPAPEHEGHRQIAEPRERSAPVIHRALVRQAVRALHQPHPALRNVAIGDNTRVLRDREAWLRSLDRKYGIVR
jgi:hypothetical protein